MFPDTLDEELRESTLDGAWHLLEWSDRANNLGLWRVFGKR